MPRIAHGISQGRCQLKVA
jgi:hypothetical protein